MLCFNRLTASLEVVREVTILRQNTPQRSIGSVIVNEVNAIQAVLYLDLKKIEDTAREQHYYEIALDIMCMTE